MLLTDDSATTSAKFSAGDVPKIFNVPGTPAPTCYYSSVPTLPPQGRSCTPRAPHAALHRAERLRCAAIIASIRKTVSVKPWTVRFDYGTPTPGRRGPPRHRRAAASTSSSARWYYNFAGAATDDKGEMGYYESTPISQGVALQAGLDKSVNVLRVETELTQVKK